MNKRLLLSISVMLAAVSFAGAQNVTDLIISEIMAEPDSSQTSIVDDYGQKNGWIEIFNTSQGTVNYGGCYLTDDRSAIPAKGKTKFMPADHPLYKYLIPKGDLRTQLGPRQTVIFYASGEGSQGTFYTDFKIRRDSWIYLVSNDKCTIIDSMYVPAALPAGMSVKKSSKDIRGMVFGEEDTFSAPTPNTPNAGVGDSKITPSGGVLTLVSVSVVFVALAILWVLFYLFFDPKNKEKIRMKSAKTESKPAAKGDMSSEVAAAIAMALSQADGGETVAAIAMAMDLYFNDSVHDSESFVVTIKADGTSAWNEKTQTFRRLPRR